MGKKNIPTKESYTNSLQIYILRGIIMSPGNVSKLQDGL
jgi:hypothetical protein